MATSDRLIGRNVRVEVGIQELAPITVTAVSKAVTGVATAAAHGLANGDVGYFVNVVGMSEIDGQIVRVANVASGTFELEGIRSTNYGTFVSGQFVKVGTWATLAKVQEVTEGSPSTNRQDATVLLDEQKEYVDGTPDSPETTMNGLTDLNSTSVMYVDEAARVGQTLAFRITFVGRSAVRLFRGSPTTPTESISVDQLVTSGWTLSRFKRRMAYGS